MRHLIDIQIPNEPFNTLVREGSIGALMQRLVESARAEAVYFTERDGRRGCTMIVDIAKASDIPALAEPWFLALNAEFRFRLVMSPEDLAAANLETIGKEWK